MFIELRITRCALEAAMAVKLSIDIDPLRKNVFIGSDISIGRNQFQLAFKQISGMTLKRYRLHKRMEVARDLLAEGHLTVKQVSLQCGYRYPSNFTGDYKKIFEVSPIDWVRTHFDNCGIIMDNSCE